MRWLADDVIPRGGWFRHDDYPEGMPVFDATLFDSLPPSVAGSPTSEAAAESMCPDAARLRMRVYGYLQLMGSQGATRVELETALDMSGNTLRPRVWELMKSGRVYESGDTRKTPSGRQAAVLRAAK